MDFKVLFKTRKGNVVLESSEKQGIEKKLLNQANQKKAMIFDTIGSIKKPFYLAKPLDENVAGVLTSLKVDNK
ncbi:MAG: hypothetical protein ABH803_02615 [Candidatus Micrarchaeota archaeon]